MSRIVFDLDGTLIDSAPDIQLAVNQMLEPEGLGAMSLAAITSFIGNGLPHLVKLVLAASAIDPSRQEELAMRVARNYDQVNGRMTRLYPGVRGALETLQAQGHSFALCTNKPRQPALDILAVLGIDGFFDQIVGGDSMAERKPHPAPLQACTPDIYVGDSEVDAETAARAGVRFALFTRGYRKSEIDALQHDVAFDTFDALPEIVQLLEAVQ